MGESHLLAGSPWTQKETARVVGGSQGIASGAKETRRVGSQLREQPRGQDLDGESRQEGWREEGLLAPGPIYPGE